MNGKNEAFGKSFDQFVIEKDPTKHRKALVALLSKDGLDEHFLKLLHDKGSVENFFIKFAEAMEIGADQREKKTLKRLNKLSNTYFKQKEYRKLCELYFDVAFKNLAEFLHLEEREDLNTLTDRDLLTKGILPQEIMVPYLLLNASVWLEDFDWNRGEEVTRQSLVCFIVCFTALYSFFEESESESEQEEESADESPAFVASSPQKIGRNDSCPCHSGKKWKKCCGGVERPLCGLCGSSGDVVKTDCCGNDICNDENKYVVFSYARNSCFRNHRRYTLCGYHHTEAHAGDWKDCHKCRDDFKHEMEMYVWYGMNEYNYTTLENPPTFEPTYCSKCGRHLVLPEGGYSKFHGEYRCERCPLSEEEQKAIIAAHEQTSEKKPAKKKGRALKG